MRRAASPLKVAGIQADFDGHGTAGVEVDAVDGDACAAREGPEGGRNPQEVGRLGGGGGREKGGKISFTQGPL